MNYYEFYKINSEEGLPFLELSAELWKENNTNNNRWIMALLCPPNVLHLQECWNDLFAWSVFLPASNMSLQSRVDTPPHNTSPPHYR